MFQNIYVFFLLCFFGITYSVNSMRNALRFGNFTSYSNMLRKYQPVDIAFIALFHIRLTLMPLIRSQSSFVSVVMNVLPLYLVGGYYLSFFFLISHNFEGVHFFDQSRESKSNESFLYAQVVSSSNVGGNILCFFNGGLNYQIEHHLFPRIQHSHYPLIAPYVREFCHVKGIPYVHFPTIWDNVISTSKHLLKMGTHVDPVKLG
jgi:fatty acid desaturase (delta-4 desaturase)